MKYKVDNFFDLNQIANSGQCFRWNFIEDNHYHILSKDRVLDVKQVDRDLYLNCSSEEFYNYWFEYFDLGRDYKSIINSINIEDTFLRKAAEKSKGIRILKQEPFETLISFIISQQKTIPNIIKTINNMSFLRGKLIDKNYQYYAFPTIQELNAMSLEELSSLKLGYREKYINKTRKQILNNPDAFNNSKSLNDKELNKYLKTFYGVGEKVANCTMLFGYQRLNAFPKDTWINKALNKEYSKKRIDDYYPYNGVIQQYIFNYYRNLKNKG